LNCSSVSGNPFAILFVFFAHFAVKENLLQITLRTEEFRSNTRVNMKFNNLHTFLLIFQALYSHGFSQNASTEVKHTISYKYDFGARANPGFIKIDPLTIYSDKTGYGFEPGFQVNSVNRNTQNPLEDGFVSSSKPFLFSIKLNEGNYDVKVLVGDKEGTADITIRAECRRMMSERITTNIGQLRSIEFTVHVRDTLIRTTGNKVMIKAREREFLHWDNKLTLEFNGPEPKINAIEIIPGKEEVITIFLAGNSTVVDQDKEPYAAWGQMIPAFFVPGKVSIANYAESGESLSSFISAKRFEKILSLIQIGDYVFVEFGHNDQKQSGAGIGAFTSYKKDLKYLINQVKKKSAIPVLVTSMHRRNFDSKGKIIQTLGDYPDAVRQTAKEENVALIDLNNMSQFLYEAWGPDDSKKAFVFYPPNTFPGQTNELKDNTHFNPYGAYEIAKCVVNGIKQNKLGIAKYLKEDLKPFDPSKPDPVTELYWPRSPSKNPQKPDGN
jgi:lysophospholipase L1-like esterase